MNPHIEIKEGSDTIGYLDMLDRLVLYCSPKGNAVILKKDGGITIATNFKVRIVFRDGHPSIHNLMGKYIYPYMSLKGSRLYRPRSKSKPAISLNYDHLGNLLMRISHSSFLSYTSGKPIKKYRFGKSQILFNKFEIALIKRKKIKILRQRKKEKENNGR
jgi:hypothetical protein